MISERQSTIAVRDWARRLERVLLMELPASQLLIIAAVVGVISATTLFDWSFVTGQHAHWRSLEVPARTWQLDQAQVLVGYLYYVQSPWHLPLFYVSALGAPGGTNVILMDVVPIVALFGKLIRTFTGNTINPYGAYLFLCYALPGVMMTLVLIAAKIRYALAAVIAAIFANNMPILLTRFGHTALLAQFLLIGALALYLLSFNKGLWYRIAIVWSAYLVLTYLTNLLLFVMIGTIWVCALIQRRLNEAATTRQTSKTGALTVTIATVIIILGGQFGAGSPLPFSRWYGVYSMNLFSPFVPQNSGLFPGLGGVIDATGGQYEGFNYLGLGLILASLLLLRTEWGWLRLNRRRHIALLAAFAAFTAFAISNRVYAGHRLLFELPLPVYVTAVLGIFRGSGRFFWPIAYAQLAIVIVLGFRRANPTLALCLLVAAILQLFDVQPLRAQLKADIAVGLGEAQFDRNEVSRLVASARYVEVVPSYQCSNDLEDELQMRMRRANMQFMFVTAKLNVPTNTVYTSRESFGVNLSDLLRAPSHALELKGARRDEYCNEEIEYARTGGRPGDLIVLLADRPRQEEMAPGVTCHPLSWARYCERSTP